MSTKRRLDPPRSKLLLKIGPKGSTFEFSLFCSIFSILQLVGGLWGRPRAHGAAKPQEPEGGSGETRGIRSGERCQSIELSPVVWLYMYLRVYVSGNDA